MSDIHHGPLQQSASSPVYIPGMHNRLKRFWGEIEIPLLIALGLISIVLGTIGIQRYFTMTDEHYSLASRIYISLDLFELRGGELPGPIPWELEVARWLSPLVTMYAVLLGLAAIFRTQIQMLRLRLASNHIIICGLDQKGLLLAKNLRSAGRLVVVIEQNGSNPSIPVCREMGIIVLPGDARDEFILRKAGVRRASHLISVCGDDGTNAEVAVKARRMVAQRRGHELNCAVHIKDPQLWIFLRQQEFSSEQMGTFRLDFFNIYANGARQILQEYPITPATLGVRSKPPHLLLVDLGHLGEQLIIHAARRWYFYSRNKSRKLHISVVDPQAKRKIESLCLRYSLVREVCRFDAYSIDISSPAFHQAGFLNRRNSDISFVYICNENETTGLSGALSLLQQSSGDNVQILVRMKEDAGLASLLRGIKGIGSGFKNLHAFGLLERTCCPSLLNDGSHESLARAIHEEYIHHETQKGNTPQANPLMVAWDELSEEFKEANRNQADEIGFKLNAIGCDVVPWNDYGAEKFSFTGDEIELMAKIEHERWCRQKMAQGWKYGPMRNDERKEHPSLIAWDDPRLNEMEKEKDRNTVRQIPEYLALAGFQLHRLFLKGYPHAP